MVKIVEPTPQAPKSGEVDRARRALLRRVEHLSELPMTVLSIVWVGLLIAQLAGTWNPLLAGMQLIIWAIFLADFLLEFLIAPAKLRYLSSHVLNLLALLVPALRIVRLAHAIVLLRLATGGRGFTLLALLLRTNRGVHAVARIFHRRGFAYVLSLTVLVAFIGAAGMLSFERGALHDYAGALWWTAMMLTTMGSDFYPHTAEGRILCLVLAIYGFTIFGYITATLSSLFVHTDARDDADVSLAALRDEIVALRGDVRALRERLAGPT